MLNKFGLQINVSSANISVTLYIGQQLMLEYKNIKDMLLFFVIFRCISCLYEIVIVGRSGNDGGKDAIKVHRWI